MVELVVHTTPSVRYNADFSDMREPHRRIMAVEGSEGIIMANDIGSSALTEEVLRVTPQMRRLFIPYFRDIVVPHDPTLPDSWETPSANYNCHHFAAAMNGVRLRGWKDGTHRAHYLSLLCSLPATGNLPLGAHGILRLAWNKEPHHSVIGLGEDTEDCLHVPCIGGDVGITNYPHIRREFKQLEKMELCHVPEALAARRQRRARQLLSRIAS